MDVSVGFVGFDGSREWADKGFARRYACGDMLHPASKFFQFLLVDLVFTLGGSQFCEKSGTLVGWHFDATRDAVEHPPEDFLSNCPYPLPIEDFLEGYGVVAVMAGNGRWWENRVDGGE